MARPTSAKSAETERRVQEALAGLASGKYKTPYQAAKDLGIAQKTMSRRVKGGKSYSQAAKVQQLLSAGKEKALADWVTEATIAGYPTTHRLLREMVEVIRERRVTQINDNSTELVSYSPIGKEWVR